MFVDVINDYGTELLTIALAIGIIVGMALFLRARGRHVDRLRRVLRGKVPIPETFKERLAKVLNADTAEFAAIGTVTFVDLAWHYSMADPAIWDHFHGPAADHMVDAIQNLDILKSTLGDKAIPVVDHILAYFQQIEATQVFHDLVHALPGLADAVPLVLEGKASLLDQLVAHSSTIASVESKISAAGDAASGGLSLLHHIPLVTIGFATYRAWRRGQKGTALKRNLEFGAIEVATRASAGLIGGQVGGIIGTFIAPGMGTIVGGVTGAVAGTLGGASLGEALKKRRIKKAQRDLDSSLTELGRTYLEDRYVELAHVFVEQEQEYIENLQQNQRRLRRYATPWRVIWPDQKLILFQETVAMAQERLGNIKQGTIDALDRLAYMRDQEQHREMGIILWSDPALCQQLPCDTHKIEVVREANDRMRYELAQLGIAA
jgi:gas vesicle protein